MHEIYDLGIILKDLRKKNGLSQKELGEKISRDKGIISRYESNLQTPSFEIMRDLSGIFNVSMDYLAGFESRDNISTFGLTKEQAEILSDLAEVFRRQKNGGSDLAECEYSIIGRICTCFAKK